MCLISQAFSAFIAQLIFNLCKVMAIQEGTLKSNAIFVFLISWYRGFRFVNPLFAFDPFDYIPSLMLCLASPFYLWLLKHLVAVDALW